MEKRQLFFTCLFARDYTTSICSILSCVTPANVSKHSLWGTVWHHISLPLADIWLLRWSDIWRASLAHRRDGKYHQEKVYLCSNISLSAWHLSSLKRGLKTRRDMFVERLVDKYRRELIKPSINKGRTPSVRFLTRPASSSLFRCRFRGNDLSSKRWRN